MNTDREQIKYAVQEMLNDVIEQGFHHLVNHPQQSDALNKIIKDASEEMNYQLLKVDSHSHKPGSPRTFPDYFFRCPEKEFAASARTPKDSTCGYPAVETSIETTRFY
jgi:hypothetical protein